MCGYVHVDKMKILFVHPSLSFISISSQIYSHSVPVDQTLLSKETVANHTLPVQLLLFLIFIVIFFIVGASCR